MKHIEKYYIVKQAWDRQFWGAIPLVGGALNAGNSAINGNWSQAGTDLKNWANPFTNNRGQSMQEQQQEGKKYFGTGGLPQAPQQAPQAPTTQPLGQQQVHKPLGQGIGGAAGAVGAAKPLGQGIGGAAGAGAAARPPAPKGVDVMSNFVR